MTIKYVCEQLKLAMKELGNINVRDSRVDYMQKKVNTAYNILNKLHEDIKNGGKK